MMVGTKAIATLSTGYLNALEYAKNRVQGADLLRQADKTAPRVTITHHPDVRRSLALQKSYAEGPARAGLLHGAVAGQGPAGRGRRRRARRRSSPSGSTTCCCRWSRAAARSGPTSCSGHESLQTFGGSGYLQDYPLEQYVRDAKIDTLYEGTTAIQSLDLIFRKIVEGRRRGAAASSPARSSRSWTPRPATASSRRSGSRWPPRSPTCRACSAR